MRVVYSLRVEHPDPAKVEGVLGSQRGASEGGWIFELTEGDEDPPIAFVEELLRLLSGKYDELAAIGVERSAISIWLLYEYDQQCNLEFRPSDLLRLGKEGLALCVSCWQR